MPNFKKKSRKINVYLNRETSLSIYGFNEDQVNQLKQIALEKYGEANISLLVRQLAKQELAKQQNSPDMAAYNPSSPNTQPKKRVVVRLPPEDSAYLVRRATLRNESLNGTVNDILTKYMEKNPVLSNDEVEAVYESNARLRVFGGHVNEIARKLNAGESVSLSTEFMKEIDQQVREHVGIVNNMLLKKRKIFQEFIESIDNPPRKGQ